MFNNFKAASSRFFSRFNFLRERPWRYIVILTLIGGGVSLIPKFVIPVFGCQINAETAHFVSSSGPLNKQVIVIGTVADINGVFGQLNLDTRLSVIEDCDLSYLNSRAAPNPELTADERKTLVMQLYEVSDAETSEEVDDIVDSINAAHGDDPNKPERYIFADRNHITSLMDSYDTCYLPNSGGGGTGGGPYGDPGGLDPYDPGAAGTSFVNQWALGTQGINTVSPSSPTLTGRRVRVAVFDTSPYRITLPSIIIRRNTIAFPPPMWFTTWDSAGSTLVSNHGLFVVGLIHRVAPESNIRLISVLNDDGCGELWVLNKALHDYTSRMSFWTGKLNRTVFNLSLAVDKDAPADEVFTLGKTIDEADRLGAAIIAAAGNDSDDTTQPPEEMRSPANSDNVIGVAAVNSKGELSCYSNKGDVAAPGGDGGLDDLTDPANPDPCAPRAETWNRGDKPCSDMANCDYGVVSLAHTRYGPRYVLWSGTSFAAPLVSGLAAMAYEKWNHEVVRCLIENGAVPSTNIPSDQLVWGIIDVENTFSSTTLSTCGVSP